MQKKSFLFVHNVWTQIALIIVFLLFISHLIAFFMLSRYNEQTQLEINRRIVIRQIITLVEAVEINPQDKWSYIVNAIDIPNVNISLDSSPRYKVRVNQMEIWDILYKLRSLPENTHSIEVSIKAGEHLWLNISALVVQSSLSFQAILFGFEFIIILVLVFIVWSINRFNKPLKRFI